MRKRTKKRSRVLNFILLGLMALLAAMTAIVTATTTSKGLAPTIYMIVMISVVGAILILSVISMRRKWSNIVMIIISGIACCGMVYAAMFTGEFIKTIDKVTGKSGDVTTIKVAVLKDSSYDSIEDLKGKTLSYLSSEEEETIDKVIADINEHVSDCDYTESRNVMSLADDLRSEDTDAIIVNESHVGMLDEVDGYETFKDEIKYIYSIDISKKVDISKDSLGDVFTLYISGIDTYGSPAATSRSDVNIIAVVNRKTKHIQLINTPRDAYVYLPNSGDMKDKLTHAGIYGIENSMKTIGNLYDIDIDGYMRVNFTGFQEIIDSIGGVDVYSDQAFTVTGGGFSYSKGMNHMNGIEALAFARERKSLGNGDNQRGIHQMRVIEAIVSKATSSGELLSNYKGVLGGLSGSMQTSVPGETIYGIINQQLSDSSGWKIDSYAVTGSGTYAETYSMPGTQLYVFNPDEDSIEEAKRLIQSVKNE